MNATRVVIGRCPWSIRVQIHGWRHAKLVFFVLFNMARGLWQGVNGVNRLVTMGEKYYWLPTQREKNYRLPTGKILTDYRHGPKLSFFRRKSILYFSTFLGSNERYHWFYKCYWKEKGKKTNISSFDGRRKCFYKYSTKRWYWNSWESVWKFPQSNPPFSPTHYLREMLRLIHKANSFQFNGKLYLQTHDTAMGTKTAVSFANIFKAYIQTH